MKKYLFKGLLALYAGGFAASCADHDVDYVPLAQRKTQAYEQTFKELIGGKDVDPNQNWGFTGLSNTEADARARAHTRTRFDDGSKTVSNGWDVTFDHTKMAEILGALPEGISAANKLNDYELESKGPIEFSIVYSVTSAADQVGVYYYDPNLDPNTDGGSYHPHYIQFVDNIQNNGFFQYGFSDDSGYQNPSINPNPNGNGYCNECKSAYGKEFYQWTCEHVMCHNFGNGLNIKVRAKKITLNIPIGYRIGFYVINGDNVMYSTKSRTNENNHFYSAIATLSDGTYAVGLEDWWWPTSNNQADFDCNDIVMAIKPTETKPLIINYGQKVTTTTVQRKVKKTLMSQGRVFCEDLGAVGLKDIDFNDIVFDARIWKHEEYVETSVDGKAVDWKFDPALYKAELCMLAAGGTIPAKMFHTTNIHDMFEGSYGQTTMLNTIDSHTGLTNSWDNMAAYPTPKTYSYKNGNEINITAIINTLLENDPEHKITLNDIPISVLWQTTDNPETAEFGSDLQDVGDLHADPGNVPHKICLPIGTLWPSERRSIIEAYPDFSSWATAETDANKDFFTHENKNPNALYYGDNFDGKLSMTNPYGGQFTNTDADLGTYYYEEIGNPTVTQTVETTEEIELQEGEILLWEGSQAMGDGFVQYLGVRSDWASLRQGGKVTVYGTNAENAIIAVRSSWGNRNFIGTAGYNTDYNNFVAFNGYVQFTLEYGNDNEHFGKDQEQVIVAGKNFTLRAVVYTPPSN
ncbi:MAG: DUF4842 domain-containing protein [Prevotella sp.]|nr:DUF4842 domain-containing protein [Prevotella sp.]